MWINGHNMFDAAAGFGGYKESGFGRDGGKEVRRIVLVPHFSKKKNKVLHIYGNYCTSSFVNQCASVCSRV